MKVLLLALMLMFPELGRAKSDPPDESLRFLFSVGGGAYPDGSVYGLHLRVNADKVTEYKAYGLGWGLEFAKSNLTVARDSEGYFYSFDYLLGLRAGLSLRTSEWYNIRFVFAGGPTQATYHASRISSAIAAGPLGIEIKDTEAKRTRAGLYGSLGLHFQREHPSLVRLSEWGLTLIYYHTRFPSGWFRDGLYDMTEAPGVMSIFLLNLHVGIGGIIDL